MKKEIEPTTVLYDRKIPFELIEKYKGLIISLQKEELTPGANPKPLKNHNLHRIKINDKGRILYTRSADNKIIIVYITEDHNYKSKLRNRKVLKKFLNKRPEEYSKITDEELLKDFDEFLGDTSEENTDVLYNNEAQTDDILLKCAHESNGNYIVFDEVQERALSTSTPIIIQGPPGSGKTSLALALLKQAVEKNQKVLYVTQSHFLANKIREEWESCTEYNPALANVLAYSDLQPDLTENGQELFQTWFCEFLQKRVKDKDKKAKYENKAALVYEEFRILSGYSKEDYINGVGQKQCLFADPEERKWLYIVYSLWRKEYPLVSDFYEFGQERQGEYDQVIVDESQDLSHIQLKNLLKLAKHGSIVYCLDPRQNLLDEKQKLIYLKNILTNQFAHAKVNEVKLPTHYRCPQAIMDFALVFNNLRIALSPKNKKEDEVARSHRQGGMVHWLEATDKASTKTLEALAQDADVCVITQKEYVDEVSKKFKFAQVFTPKQAKGLEYKKVVLYKLLNSEKLYKVNELLERKIVSDQDAMCSAELSACFAGATRATDELYVVQNAQKDHRLKNIIKPLQEKVTQSLPQETLNGTNKPSSPDEFKVKAEDLAKRGLIVQARNILKLNLAYDDSAAEEQLKQWNSYVFAPNQAKKKMITVAEFHRAVATGDLKTVRQYLSQPKRKINIKDKYHHLTPLQVAAMMGFEELVKILLDQPDINVNQKADDGMTALHLAACKKFENIYALLFNDKRIDLSIKDNDGMTALELERISKEHVATELLTQEIENSEKILYKEADVFLKAAKNGDLVVVQEYLKKPVKFVNAIDTTRGASALHHAADGGFLQIVAALLGEVDVNVNVKDNFGLTPIHAAALTNNVELIYLLMKDTRVDLNAQDTVGRTALHHATQSGDLGPVMALIKDPRVNINAQDINGTTPLQLAVLHQQKECVLALLNAGASVKIKDNSGFTVVDIARMNENHEIITILSQSILRQTLHISIRELLQGRSQHFTTSLEKQGYLHAADFSARVVTGKNKGKSALWYLAFAALEHPEHMMAVLNRFPGEFKEKNFTHPVEEGRFKGVSVLSLAVEAAQKGKPECLLEILKQYPAAFDSFTAHALAFFDADKGAYLLELIHKSQNKSIATVDKLSPYFEQLSITSDEKEQPLIKAESPPLLSPMLQNMVANVKSLKEKCIAGCDAANRKSKSRKWKKR